MADQFDVVMVTDCCLPGGTAASVAEEVKAQHRAGLRTGLVHVPSRLMARPRGFNPRLQSLVDAGAADVALSGSVRAEVAILRHPAVFDDDIDLPHLEVDRTVVVMNQTPWNRDQSRQYYDLERVRRTIEERVGGTTAWTPIGPLIREAIQSTAPDLRLTPDDWFNIIDVNEWAVDPARRFDSRRVVLGRHSRDDPRKWPSTAAELLAAYPEDPRIDVRILGGEGPTRDLLGTLPRNWTVLPFGSRRVDRFLADLDVWVYFHHPTWVESFGRTILEAMASGVPMILPPHFADLFGSAPVYGTPSRVRDQVLKWRDDPDDARDRAAAGQAHVRQRFSHETHLRRLSSLLSDPVPDQRRAVVPSTPDRPDARRVLFISSNGAGIGHLMRLMAMARRAREDVRPMFLTLSQAVPVVRQIGFPCEYLMSRGYADMVHAQWHALFRARCNDLIHRHDVRAVVFDGTWPYRGLLEALDDNPHVAAVWSRRGMWRPDITDSPALQTADRFDLIVEPGEFAAAVDRGLTSRRRHEALVVDPITYLEPHEVLDRDQARHELGLDRAATTVLVQLGAGNINDVESVTGAVIDHLGDRDVQVCLTRSIIGSEEDVPAHVVTLRGVYPLARYLRAFDMAIAASGYNSTHELLEAGVPTLFVPNLRTATDDQAARARHAASIGVALDAGGDDPDSVVRALQELLDPQRRRQLGQQARDEYPGNGAGVAMRAVEALLDGIVPTRGGDGPAPVEVPEGGAPPAVRWDRVRGRLRRRAREVLRSLPDPIRQRILVLAGRSPDPDERGTPVPPGPRLPREQHDGLAGVGIVLSEGLSRVDRQEGIHRLAQLQVTRRDFAPLVVTSDADDLTQLRGLGMPVELLLDREGWELLDEPVPYEDYRRERLQHLAEVWDLDRIVPYGGPSGPSGLELLTLVP